MHSRARPFARLPYLSFTAALLFAPTASHAAPESAATAATAGAPAKKEDVAAEVAEVQRRAAGRKDFSVTFQQEVYSALRKKSSESKGSLAYQPPGKFRWELQGKKQELYVSNGKDFWKYDASNKHAQRLPPESAALDFIDVVTKLSRLSELFAIEAWKATQEGGNDAAAAEFFKPPSEPGSLLVKLTPKAQGQQQAVFLAIDRNSNTIIEMRIAFRNGNRTRLVLTNLKEAPVDPKTFDFTPPPGTAVDRL